MATRADYLALKAKVDSIYEMLNTKLKIKHLEVEEGVLCKGRVTIGVQANSDKHILKVNGGIHHLGNIHSTGTASFNDGQAVFNNGNHALNGTLNVKGNTSLKNNVITEGSHYVGGDTNIGGDGVVQGNHTCLGDHVTYGDSYVKNNLFVSNYTRTSYLTSESIIVSNFEGTQSSQNKVTINSSGIGIFGEDNEYYTNPQTLISPNNLTLQSTSPNPVYINNFETTLYSITNILAGNALFQTSTFNDPGTALVRLPINQMPGINTNYSSTSPLNGAPPIISFYNTFKPQGDMDTFVNPINYPIGSIVSNVLIESLGEFGESLIKINNHFFNNTENTISLTANQHGPGGNNIQLNSTDTGFNKNRNNPPPELAPVDYPYYNSNTSLKTGCGKPNITIPISSPDQQNLEYRESVYNSWLNNYSQPNTGAQTVMDGSSLYLSGTNCVIDSGQNVPVDMIGRALSGGNSNVETSPPYSPNEFRVRRSSL